ncbi:MAG: rhodanese-like domain-containing protein [Thermonemataceae bacterium]|nr:rhodanese-like domain-containing protein [Thermonemataceae bacterium]
MMDISSQELQKRLQDGENVNVLDVREEWEHEEMNIGNSKLIPLAELPFRLAEIEAWKAEEVVVYCYSGNRSGRAKEFLQSKGFEKVRNLLGGISEYFEE